MIELLVTIVVMGIAFAVIVGGLGISILGSDVNRRQASAETVLRNFAEHVKTRGACAPADACDDQGYLADCIAAKSSYQSAFTAGPGFTATVVSVSPANSTDATAFMGCSAAPAADSGLQLVVLSVTMTSDNRPVTETVDVVKRRHGLAVS